MSLLLELVLLLFSLKAMPCAFAAYLQIRNVKISNRFSYATIISFCSLRFARLIFEILMLEIFVPACIRWSTTRVNMTVLALGYLSSFCVYTTRVHVVTFPPSSHRGNFHQDAVGRNNIVKIRKADFSQSVYILVQRCTSALRPI